MPDFVILSNSPWNSKGRGGNSSQQYALAVMRRGWRVHYADMYGVRSFTPLSDLAPGPGTVVMCDNPWVKYYADLFFELKAQGCSTVYRAVDNWLTTPYRGQYCEERELAYVRESDLAVASNPLTVERFRPCRPDIDLLRNGVDLDHFWNWSGTPSAEIKRGQPTVVLVTSLWAPDWIDWPALFYAAESCPEMVINVLANPENFPQHAFTNINLIGIRSWQILPAYLRQCDVGVIPYLPDKARYTNPLKALEYLASGLPVVHAPNPSITDYPYMYQYDSPADFVSQIQAAAQARLEEAALHQTLSQHTWDQRLEILLAKLGNKVISPIAAGESVA